MTTITASLSHLANVHVQRESGYPAELNDIASLAKSREAYEEISRWPGYRPTPLHRLDDIASRIGVAAIYYKDEAQRFDLKSFKALGGAYAVARQLRQRILAETGNSASVADLLEGNYDTIVNNVVVSCATDGNHGRSVAWGCQMFGCGCVIYIHRDVSIGRKQAMEKYGAEVIRVDGNYDDSVKQADTDARLHGRIVVSDTSYPGYMEIPRDVAIGYTVMLIEAVEQLDGEIPTHVFIQAGVGGLAAAVCAFFWELWGESRPRLIVVEPEQANCLQQSAASGQPVAVEGDLETLMAGLSCGEVPLLAWEVLKQGADDFLTLGESAVAPCMRLLANTEPAIEAGESGVAGIGAAIVAGEDAALAKTLELDASSRIFVIGTEGATDPDLYRELITG